MVFVRFEADAAKAFCLRWIGRPLAFALPLPLVAWWCDVPPDWNMAALAFFCIVWSDSVHLFGRQDDAAESRAASGRRAGTARRWYDWDFDEVEAATAASLRFTGRAIVFTVPALFVARWCGMQMGWKLLAWLAFCVIWNHVVDRVAGRLDQWIRA
jgi:hypothetical protein